MFDDDAITISDDSSPAATELLEAVEWLRQEGFLTNDVRPFAGLLNEGDDGVDIDVDDLG